MKITQLFIALLLTTPIFSQPGALDLTFGDSGKVLTRFDEYHVVPHALKTQLDGKILLAGIGAGEIDFDIIALRYLPNGQPDPTFGLYGRLILNISDFSERCYDAAIDQNGNIFLAGITHNENFQIKGFIIKLFSDGQIDSSFAQNGLWVNAGPEEDEEFKAMLLQSDGKILIAGRTTLMGEPNACTLMRLHVDGTLDLEFGINGIAKATVPDSYIPEFVKLTENGDIITGGFLDTDFPDVILVKFNQHGGVDSTFGSNGIVVEETDYYNPGRDLAIQSDNKILVATGILRTPGSVDFAMLRYLPNGALDNSFGQNGLVTTDFSDTSSNAFPIVLQEDGKIILGGFSGRHRAHDFAIARYDTNGNLDHTFGNNGKVTTDFGLDDLLFLATLQSDGKLLCAGISRTPDVSSFLIARYLTGTETNINDITREFSQVKVLPNPSDGHFTVSFTLEKSSAVSMSIFNASGQLVQSVVDDQYMMKGPNKLDIPLNHSLADGMYILKIETGNDYFTQKLVIQR